MIEKDKHPWGNFLHARKLAIEWLSEEMKYNEEEIAKCLSMDKLQVRLIRMTSVEK